MVSHSKWFERSAGMRFAYKTTISDGTTEVEGEVRRRSSPTKPHKSCGNRRTSARARLCFRKSATRLLDRVDLTGDSAIVVSLFGATFPTCKLKSKPSAFTGPGSTKSSFGAKPIKRGFFTRKGRPSVEGLPRKPRAMPL